MKKNTTEEIRLVWFRSDLRVLDNPALYQACQPSAEGLPIRVIACFIRPESQWQLHDWGSNKQRYTERCTDDLRQQLKKLNIHLVTLNSSTFSQQSRILLQLCQHLNIDTLYINEEPELNERERDTALLRQAQSQGVQCQFFHDQSLIPLGQLLKPDGSPYRVYSAFRKKCLQFFSESPVYQLPVPNPLSEYNLQIPDLDHKTFNLWQPETYDSDPIQSLWPASETLIKDQLEQFCASALNHYKVQRDIPINPKGTSLLSPALAVGKISVRHCWLTAQQLIVTDPQAAESAQCWQDELLWREFYRHLLVLYPDLSKGLPFKAETQHIRWRNAPDDLKRWQQGQTGFPLVDAAMRQLRQTGWMHNRLRMLTAVFLSKYLLIDWREGERWFMQHLIDADLASNNGGWQWAASTGTDAVPYFRLLSPYRQAERFDPQGEFIARFIPELSGLAAKKRIQPDLSVLSYPDPITDLKKSRLRALDEFKRLSELK